jgi:hypothetical protein
VHVAVSALSSAIEYLGIPPSCPSCALLQLTVIVTWALMLVRLFVTVGVFRLTQSATVAEALGTNINKVPNIKVSAKSIRFTFLL